MKIYLLFLCLLAETSSSMNPTNQKAVTQNAIQADTTKAYDSLSISAKGMIKNSNQSSGIVSMDSGRINIIVRPAEASDASIMLIQKSRTKVYPFEVFDTRPIELDTLGIWKAPLSMQMSFGDYVLILHKEGFKDLADKVRFIKNDDSISIGMISLAYLRYKREQWRSYMWISAGISIVAGITSYYFYTRVKKYEDEYNEAISSDVAHDKHDQTDRNRRYYKISSGSTFAALGCFAVSWSFELSY